MRRLALIILATVVLPGAADAQTWGQPHYSAQPAPYGQPYGGPVAYGYGGYGGHSQSYGEGYGAGYGDPRAYRPPLQYGHAYDRGGRYGHSNRSDRWTRWSSPPGRGYHDVYGYNDDRAPRGADHGRYRDRDCSCGFGGDLYDR